jgi:hypothetical protein
MDAATSRRLVMRSRAPNGNGARALLFAYTASHEERQIARIRGYESAEGIVVDWEAYSVYHGGCEARRAITFPTQAHARHFTEDALTALEYLGCAIEDQHPPVTQTPKHQHGQNGTRKAVQRAQAPRRSAASNVANSPTLIPSQRPA